MANPAWARAPVLLRRFPGLLAAVVGASFVLAVASASQPLFISSAGNAALHHSLAGLCPWTIGMQISALQPLSGAPAAGPLGQHVPSSQLFSQRDAFVESTAATIPHLGSKLVTVFGSIAVARSPAKQRVAPLVRLMARDGFRSHIQAVSTASGTGGVWVPDDWASFGRVRAGDALDLQMNGHTAHTRVAGIYRSLLSRPPSSFWCSEQTEIFGLDPNSAPPSVFMADRATMFDLSRRIEDGNASTTWEFPVREQGLTLEEAQDTASATLAAQLALQAGPIFRPQAVSQIQSIVPQVLGSLDQIRSPAASVALAGRLVALAVLAAIGVYWLDRRRIEAALLVAKGVGPLGIASKAGLEMLLPLAAAAAAGWYAAIWLVRWLGPGSLLSPSAGSDALWVVGWTGLVGAILLVLTVAATVRLREAAGGAGSSVVARTPWEVVIILLMGASLYEILTRGGGTVTLPSGQTKVDILLILFPILFVAGGAGLAARALGRLLPRLRRLGATRSPAVFLAARRLAAASGIALGLLTAVALAIGILAYAGTLSASTEASASAKAEVFVGSDVRATLLAGAQAPPSLRSSSTMVLQDDRVSVDPGRLQVTVIGVDTATFARVAFWDRSFADRPLADLMRTLASPSTPVPALVTGGDVPTSGTLGFTRLAKEVPYRIAGTIRAFPMQTQHETFVIVDRSRLVDERPEFVSYLLAKGSGDAVLDALSRASVPFTNPVTASQVRENPTVIALTWLYGYLLAVAVVTGLIVLAALVLYLAARQRGRVVSYALARRMGLTAGQHRRSLGLEIAGMLLIGFALGIGLAWLGAWLVFAKLDPLPDLPPAALFRLPWALVGGAGAVLLAAAWVGARVVQRRASRADVAEVMRVAG